MKREEKKCKWNKMKVEKIGELRKKEKKRECERRKEKNRGRQKKKREG